MPSTWKSEIGSVSGATGGQVGEVEDRPPLWLGIPDNDTNFKDLPDTYDLNPYVIARPPATITTDVGTVDEGVLTLPEGTPIGPVTVTCTATNELGTDVTTFIWEVSVEEEEEATLYRNARLAGGDPDIKDPPTFHTFPFDTGEVEAEILRDGVSWEWTTSGNNQRIFLQYTHNNNPLLDVGTSYVFTIDVECLSGLNTNVITMSNQSNITIVSQSRQCPVGERRTCYMAFTIDDAAYTYNFRFGTGITTLRSETYKLRRPKLLLLGEVTPVWETIPDQSTQSTDLPEQLDVSIYVTSPIPITGWETSFGEISDEGVLTIPEGTPAGDYNITITAINAVVSEDSAPFLWEILDTGEEAPVITLQPFNRTVTPPSGTSFLVQATHPTSELFYEWEASDDGSTWVSPELLASDVDIDSISTNRLVLNSTTHDESVERPPNIIFHPQSKTVVAPNSTSFTVVATHATETTLYYEWEVSEDGTIWQDPVDVLGTRVNAGSINQQTLIINETEA